MTRAESSARFLISNQLWFSPENTTHVESTYWHLQKNMLPGDKPDRETDREIYVFYISLF